MTELCLNPASLARHIQNFVHTATISISQFTPSLVLQLETALNKYLSEPPALTEIGDDFLVSQHLRIKICPDPVTKNIVVNLIPLSIPGLDVCAMMNIRIDESLQARIRKLHDEQYLREILSNPPREAVQPKRSLHNKVQQGREVVEEEELRSDVVPVADSGHDGTLGSVDVQRPEDADSFVGEPDGNKVWTDGLGSS